MNRHLLLCALLGAAALAHAEQVYKWTDAQGITHYSDSPPPSEAQNVQTVRVTGGDRPHALQPLEGGAPPAPDASKPANAPAGPPAGTNVADTAENRERNCKTARANLEMLQSKYPIAIPTADGKQQVVDDKTRQAAVTAASAQVAQFCQ